MEWRNLLTQGFGPFVLFCAVDDYQGLDGFAGKYGTGRPSKKAFIAGLLVLYGM